MRKYYSILMMLAMMVAALTFTACGDDDDITNFSGKSNDPLINYRWVEGKYSGTYRSVSASANSNDEFLKLYGNPPWNEKSITVKIELNQDTTMNLFIRGGYNSTLEHSEISFNEDTTRISCGRYSFYKKSQSMNYNSFNYGVYNNGWSGGWIRGEELKAYKDIE